MEEVNRVVLFGAGASHGAREPRPPLGKGLHCYVLKYLREAWIIRKELNQIEDGDGTRTEEVRKKLEELLKKASSFEGMANNLLKKEEKDLLGKLNYLMACALTPPLLPREGEPIGDPKVDEAFIEKPDIYDGFLRMRFYSRENLEKATFITLNYDCLLERAICRFLKEPQDGEGQCLCKHVNYWLTEDGSGIEVLKPHGSINWFGNILGGIIIEGYGRRRTYKHFGPVTSPIDEDPEALLIAHYAPGKGPQANHETLSIIQDQACDRVSKADVIEVIGVHLPTDPTDDPFLSKILDLMKSRVMARICRVDHITPDPLEVEKARSAFNFNPIKETFGEYVNKQKGYRKIQ